VIAGPLNLHARASSFTTSFPSQENQAFLMAAAEEGSTEQLEPEHLEAPRGLFWKGTREEVPVCVSHSADGIFRACSRNELGGQGRV